MASPGRNRLATRMSFQAARDCLSPRRSKKQFFLWAHQSQLGASFLLYAMVFASAVDEKRLFGEYLRLAYFLRRPCKSLGELPRPFAATILRRPGPGLSVS